MVRGDKRNSFNFCINFLLFPQDSNHQLLTFHLPKLIIKSLRHTKHKFSYKIPPPNPLHSPSITLHKKKHPQSSFVILFSKKRTKNEKMKFDQKKIMLSYSPILVLQRAVKNSFSPCSNFQATSTRLCHQTQIFSHVRVNFFFVYLKSMNIYDDILMSDFLNIFSTLRRRIHE